MSYPLSALRRCLKSHLRCWSSTDGGWSDWFLSWSGPVWALPEGCGAVVGWRSRAQWHRALQSVPGTPAPIHQPGSGCTVNAPFITLMSTSRRRIWKANKQNLVLEGLFFCKLRLLRFYQPGAEFSTEKTLDFSPQRSECVSIGLRTSVRLRHSQLIWLVIYVTRTNEMSFEQD